MSQRTTGLYPHATKGGLDPLDIIHYNLLTTFNEKPLAALGGAPCSQQFYVGGVGTDM